MNIDKIKSSDKEVRIEQSVRKDVEYKYTNSQKKVAGHTLFSFNTVTKELKVADLKRSVSIGFNLQPVYKTEVTKEKDCIYIQALNKANAIKRIKKLGYNI